MTSTEPEHEQPPQASPVVATPVAEPAATASVASEQNGVVATESLLPRLRKKPFKFSCKAPPFSIVHVHLARRLTRLLTFWQRTRVRTTARPSTAFLSAMCCPSMSACSRRPAAIAYERSK